MGGISTFDEPIELVLDGREILSDGEYDEAALRAVAAC